MMIVIVSILLAVAALILFLTILLGVVVLGIRREPANAELTKRAPTIASYLTRRLLGVYVRRPDDTDEREACLAGHASTHDGRGDSR
jgi:hypothetical protein